MIFDPANRPPASPGAYYGPDNKLYANGGQLVYAGAAGWVAPSAPAAPAAPAAPTPPPGGPPRPNYAPPAAPPNAFAGPGRPAGSNEDPWASKGTIGGDRTPFIDSMSPNPYTYIVTGLFFRHFTSTKKPYAKWIHILGTLEATNDPSAAFRPGHEIGVVMAQDDDSAQNSPFLRTMVLMGGCMRDSALNGGVYQPMHEVDPRILSGAYYPGELTQYGTGTAWKDSRVEVSVITTPPKLNKRTGAMVSYNNIRGVPLPPPSKADLDPAKAALMRTSAGAGPLPVAASAASPPPPVPSAPVPSAPVPSAPVPSAPVPAAPVRQRYNVQANGMFQDADGKWWQKDWTEYHDGTAWVKVSAPPPVAPAPPTPPPVAPAPPAPVKARQKFNTKPDGTYTDYNGVHWMGDWEKYWDGAKWVDDDVPF